MSAKSVDFLPAGEQLLEPVASMEQADDVIPEGTVQKPLDVGGRRNVLAALTPFVAAEAALLAGVAVVAAGIITGRTSNRPEVEKAQQKLDRAEREHAAHNTPATRKARTKAEDELAAADWERRHPKQ